jgi:hypothetical protein
MSDPLTILFIFIVTIVLIIIIDYLAMMIVGFLEAYVSPFFNDLFKRIKKIFKK